ncbi:MAG: hypothetical protein H7287_05195 [Thermoleophilia bacterium]|nr:hypothetical protein [Thermoleophilia bacterium]
MGLGGIIEGVGSAARAAQSLRSWSMLASEAAHLAPGLERRFIPALLSESSSFVRPIDEALVRTTGWEMRNAVSWINDGLCVERAAVTALSAAQHETGSVAGALTALTTKDARLGATIVAYQPSKQVMGVYDNLHAAAYFETTNSKQLVIDHTFALPGRDGVMEVGDWLRRIGAKADNARLIPSNFTPPASARASAGVPVMAKPIDQQGWRTEIGLLADKLDPPVRTRDRYGALARS